MKNTITNVNADAKSTSAKTLILSFLTDVKNEKDLTETQNVIDFLLKSFSYEKYYELLRKIVNDSKMLNEAHDRILKIISDYNETFDCDYVIENNKMLACKNDLDMFILLHLISLSKTRKNDLAEITFDVLDFMLSYNRYVI